MSKFVKPLSDISRTIIGNIINLESRFEEGSSSSRYGLTQKFMKQTARNNNIRLSEIVDIDQELGNFPNNTLWLTNLRVLFQKGKFGFTDEIFTDNSERPINIEEDKQVVLSLV